MVDDLAIDWRAGLEGGKRMLSRDSAHEFRDTLIGPLNSSKPNRIQILGGAEIRLLDNDTAGGNTRLFLEKHCDLILITDSHQPPESLMNLANERHIPLFVSDCSYNDCLNTLRYRLTQFLAKRSVIHGVLMDVLGTGVLITGDSGVGKSELALELVSRGHILVADDAPEFRRIAPETLEGSCPPLLRDFLEVRGLGILNIARMYGHAHTRRRKILKFIIKLRSMEASELLESIDRLSDAHRERDILGVTITERTLPVAPGRNLAVLVEAAVRNHILMKTGYDASIDLTQKQAELLE